MTNPSVPPGEQPTKKSLKDLLRIPKSAVPTSTGPLYVRTMTMGDFGVIGDLALGSGDSGDECLKQLVCSTDNPKERDAITDVDFAALSEGDKRALAEAAAALNGWEPLPPGPVALSFAASAKAAVLAYRESIKATNEKLISGYKSLSRAAMTGLSEDLVGLKALRDRSAQPAFFSSEIPKIDSSRLSMTAAPGLSAVQEVAELNRELVTVVASIHTRVVEDILPTWHSELEAAARDSRINFWIAVAAIVVSTAVSLGSAIWQVRVTREIDRANGTAQAAEAARAAERHKAEVELLKEQLALQKQMLEQLRKPAQASKPQASPTTAN